VSKVGFQLGPLSVLARQLLFWAQLLLARLLTQLLAHFDLAVLLLCFGVVSALNSALGSARFGSQLEHAWLGCIIGCGLNFPVGSGSALGSVLVAVSSAVDYLALVLSRHSTWLLTRLGYRLEQARLGCIVGCGLDFGVGSGFQQFAVKSSDSKTSKFNTDFSCLSPLFSCLWLVTWSNLPGLQ
jgi:hypothetical protein